MANHSKFIKLLLSFVIAVCPIFIINNAYAGAAEKWEYDVIPDQSQTLQIKGHKVDQYGAAVNDYDYNTKIDPKTAANRTKMGTVGFGRLLKVTGWGLLGSAALEALLESVDWILDPESQSIWRNKVTTSNGFACKNFGYKWQATNTYTCPADAFNDNNICKTNSNAKDCKIKELWADQYYTVKVSNLPDSSVPPRIYIEVSFNYAGVADKNYIIAYKADKNTAEQPKEILTPEALADYANHTHPDYSNPELAPKLAPKYSPSIQTDLWKPSNPWEDTNSPTVQEAKKKLDEAQPEPKTDPELTPNPDTGGMTLPSFCSWASPVCEFIKDMKDVFKYEPLDDTALDIEPDNSQEINTQVSFSTQCPAPINLANFSYHGISQSWTVDFSKFCDVFATYLKPVVISIGAFSAVLIVSGVGVRENG